MIKIILLLSLMMGLISSSFAFESENSTIPDIPSPSPVPVTGEWRRIADNYDWSKAPRRTFDLDQSTGRLIPQKKSSRKSCENIIIRGGSVFRKNTWWDTCTGYKIFFQNDGNFVVYNPSRRAVWNSGTGGSDAVKLVMQDDGNLVIYNSNNRPIWYSGTDIRGSFLAIQQDGNVVIYKGRQAIWNTDTGGR